MDILPFQPVAMLYSYISVSDTFMSQTSVTINVKIKESWQKSKKLFDICENGATTWGSGANLTKFRSKVWTWFDAKRWFTASLAFLAVQVLLNHNQILHLVSYCRTLRDSFSLQEQLISISAFLSSFKIIIKKMKPWYNQLTPPLGINEHIFMLLLIKQTLIHSKIRAALEKWALGRFLNWRIQICGNSAHCFMCHIF